MPYRLNPTHTKREVDYSLGHPGSTCGDCRYYHPGAYTSTGRCEKVKGAIDAGMWCKLFEKERDA